eukprot:scaffold7994_cov122-Isochrysis_galbana.AAC.7
MACLTQLAPLLNPLPPIAYRRHRAPRQLLDDPRPLRPHLTKKADDGVVLLRLPCPHVLVNTARHLA